MPTLNSSFSFPKFDLHGLDKPRFHGHNREQVKQVGREADVPPQKIVGRHVVNTLEKALNTDGLSLQGLDADDFTPEKVADNIMSSVRQAFGRFKQSQPEADEDVFFSQIKEGLEKGFDEARDILQGLGALQGEIAENVDKTYDLTMQGLEQLESNGVSVGESTMAFQSLATQASRSAEIQIETQEGDIVTVSFNQSISSSRSALQIDQAGSSLGAFQESHEESSGFNITVEGDLNKDEQKSLKKLMKNMHKVSNAFFHGNGKAAMKHAQKMGFNTEQIAGFSMDLSMQKYVQAVAAYQQTREPEQAMNTDVLSQVGNFINQAKDLLADVDAALQSLADPKRTFNDLFAEIGLLMNDESEAQGADQLLAGLIDNISTGIFGKDVMQEVA